MCSHSEDLDNIYAPVVSNQGFYETTDHLPIDGLLNLSPFDTNPRLDDTGLDIFILGFDKSKYQSKNVWYKDIISTVLKDFMLSIYYEKLEITIKDGEETININKESLLSIINEFSTTHTTLDKDIHYQYLILNHAEHDIDITLDEDPNFSFNLKAISYKDKETISKFRDLYPNTKIKFNEERNAGVYFIRYPYMLICKNTNMLKELPIFAMCIIENNQLNKQLRRLENPQHTKWNPLAKNLTDDKTMYDRFHTKIEEQLREWYRNDDEDVVDFACTLSEYSVDDDKDRTFPNKIEIGNEITKKAHEQLVHESKFSDELASGQKIDGEADEFTNTLHEYNKNISDTKINCPMPDEIGLKHKLITANRYECYNIAVDPSCGKYDLCLDYDKSQTLKVALRKVSADDTADDYININYAYINGQMVPVEEHRYITVDMHNDNRIIITYETDEEDFFASEVLVYES